MGRASKQELQIVEAFSSVDVPAEVLRASNIRELIQGMTAEQDAVKSTAKRLEELRQEQKDGTFLGNWWHNRDDKVQDAQLDLNKSIGRLTQKSSQLLIVNTAISKILNDQQGVLLTQQKVLESQTKELAEQNDKILQQQRLLEEQQHEINLANQGLLEAKGLTQAQAQELIGCVKLVKAAEGRLMEANQTLRAAVEQQLVDTVDRCLHELEAGFSEQKQQQAAFEQQLSDDFAAQAARAAAAVEQLAQGATQLKAEVEQQLRLAESALNQKAAELEHAWQQLRGSLANELQKHRQEQAREINALLGTLEQLKKTHEAALQEQSQALALQGDAFKRDLEHCTVGFAGKTEALEGQLAALQDAVQKARRNTVWAGAAIGCVALASLGWQLAQHFALL